MKKFTLYVDSFECVTIDQLVKIARGTGHYLPDIISEGIKLTTTNLTFGNRYWFVCSECSRRVGKLYQNMNGLSCRKCLGLVYRDQNQHRNKHFEYVIKPLKKLRRIEIKLNKKLRLKDKQKLLNKYYTILEEVKQSQ